MGVVAEDRRQTMDDEGRNSWASRVEQAIHESGYSLRDLSYRMRRLMEDSKIVGVPHSPSSLSAWARGGPLPKRIVCRVLAEATVPEVPLDGETPTQRRRHVAEVRRELEEAWDHEDRRRRESAGHK